MLVKNPRYRASAKQLIQEITKNLLKSKFRIRIRIRITLFEYKLASYERRIALY